MSELYDLPKGWEWKKLGDIAKIQNGFAFKSKLFTNNGFSIIKIANLVNGILDIKNCVKFNKNDYDIKLDKYIINKGDILVAMTGEPKVSICQYDDILYLNQRVGKINAGDSVLQKYILYFLKISFFKVFEKALGVAQKNLSTQQINNISIPLPPLEEQKRIVAKLDSLFEKIDKAINLHKSNIEKIDKFMPSVLNDVFENLEAKYKKSTLGNLVKIIGGGTPSKAIKEYWENGDIKWATVRDMNTEKITDTKLSITKIGLKNSSSNIVPKEGIVIATRVGLGKVCYLNLDVAINQDLKGLLPIDNNLDIRYLFNYFKFIENYIIENGTGATVKGVKLNFIREIKIPLPPLPIQQKVVKYLDKISQNLEKVKLAQQKKLDSLNALKASILDKAFKGEL